MTPAEKMTEFAARITDAIPDLTTPHLDADRARVARDLTGYLRALDGLAECHRWWQPSRAHWVDTHAARYTAYRDDHEAALILTGSLYGVTP